MSVLSSHIVIDAPADTVWQVIAGRFDRIGDWAAAIPASAPAAGDPGLVDVAARWAHEHVTPASGSVSHKPLMQSMRLSWLRLASWTRLR